MKWHDESPSSDLPLWSGTPDRQETTQHALGAAPSHDQPWIGVAARAYDSVMNHLRGHRVERGGLLLGTAHATDTAQAHLPGRIWIAEAVPAQQSDGDRVSLRMDSSVWRDANARLEQLRAHDPATRIVGWFHSHPRLGAFFSTTDCRTQRAFFHHAYSVGWVIDPFADEHAAFLGEACQAVALRLLATPWR